MENKTRDMIAIPMEEYKELLIIKGKYEEIRRIQKPLILYDGYRENGTTIMPCGDRAKRYNNETTI